MKLKSKPQDFRVMELLHAGYLADRGRFRVYRVTKKKLTSFEAAKRLADLARVQPAEVGLAGLKDRQGITTQFMSVHGGRPVRWSSDDLKIEHVGFAREALSSACSAGNAFEVTLRGLSDTLRTRLQQSLEEVRRSGFVNYFGEQRFGNLRFGQGWIALDLARGDIEKALKNLITGRSEHDDERHATLKQLLAARWGNWRACRDLAGKLGAHHSVFEVLSKDPEDLFGALRRVAARLRLIHLYAWQSHLWNRAVDNYVSSITPAKDRMFVSMLEGRLSFARGPLAADPAFANRFRLPGAGLEDVEHDVQRELFTAVLKEQELSPEGYRIEGIGGFQLKGEDRELVVVPHRLRVRFDPREPDRATLRFELPRGSYATMLVARLLGVSAEPYAPRGFEGARGRARREDEDDGDDDRPRRVRRPAASSTDDDRPRRPAASSTPDSRPRRPERSRESEERRPKRAPAQPQPPAGNRARRAVRKQRGRGKKA